MNETIEVSFSTENYELYIHFLVDLKVFEKRSIQNTNIEGEKYITSWISFSDLNNESTDIDNPYYIFHKLYKALKNKDKKFLKESLKEEFKLIWECRKPLKKLIKDLRNKYPELKNKENL